MMLQGGPVAEARWSLLELFNNEEGSRTAHRSPWWLLAGAGCPVLLLLMGSKKYFYFDGNLTIENLDPSIFVMD